ncbi:MAG: IPT/TIG domain-containing protein [Candidatus Riflebacteria bacterium]|nr:IPT/TIG domain-containing protein [Candidatus Riflebacteria bacterium]
MKRILLLFILLVSIFILGCSSGGSSKPVSVATGPVITSIYPTSGGPGTLTTIQGSNFGIVQSTSIVSYAGVTVIPTTWSNTQITLTLPANAQNNGNFLVVVGGVYSNSSVPFNLSGPVISYLSPTTGTIGSDVTVYGQYFGIQTNDTYVTFNNTPAIIKSWSNTSITCTVPDSLSSQSGTAQVIVWLDAYRYSSSFSFNLTLPTISMVNPNIDNIGARITITGQAFGQTWGTISLGGISAQILNWSDSTIEFRVPQVNYAGYHTLILTAGGRQISNGLTVKAPEATNYSPSPIGKDQTLTITGNYFGATDDPVTRKISIADYGDVNIGTHPITWSDNSLSFKWPVSNTWLGTKNVLITISIGGLTQTFTVIAE